METRGITSMLMLLVQELLKKRLIYSPAADLANAHKGSTICRQDMKFVNNDATCLPKIPTASLQHLATLENLPDELLTNIFIRLLAKQLALLSQPSFIKSHLHRSIHNKNQILLVFHDDEDDPSDIKPFTVKPTRSPNLELTNFIKLPANHQLKHINGIRIIGSVNGLICSRYGYGYGDSIIHIWNPSLSTVLTLPPYSTPSRDANESITGKYTNVVKWWLQVEIYSMRKGSWELITGRFPSHIEKISAEDNICIHSHDGRLNWLGCNYTNNKIDSQSQRILSFDLGSETFREIHLPDSTLDPDRFNEVGVLADKLYVLSYIIEDDKYEVWVMVAESWVKRYVFSQFTDDTCPFGFTLKNEFLIEHAGFLVLCDPFANKEKIVDGYCPEEQCIDKIVDYVESLVWVAPV